VSGARTHRGAQTVVAIAALAAALASGASGAVSLRPPPGTPDPKQMVLRSPDLGGAKVSSQGYYKDQNFPSVISYKRELRAGRMGATRLGGVESEAEIGISVRTTVSFFNLVKRTVGSKQERTFRTKELKKEGGGDLGLISNIQIGRLVNLRVGDASFDLPVTFRFLSLKTQFHIAWFRVDRVLCTLVVAGTLGGGRVPHSAIARLAKLMVSRARVELIPKNTALPVISGIPQAGQTLTTTTGVWSGSPTSFTYQWQRCDAAGANCVDIPGATAASYVVTDADAGATLRVVVTARNSSGSAAATSAPTAVVAAVGAPTNTSPPTISGTAQQGQMLTAGTGSWTGNPTSFGFQWQRCNALGASCVDIPGATGGTYVVGSGDVGSTLRVAVTATNAVGSATAVSQPTGVVV
jgi:hypothetical protein